MELLVSGSLLGLLVHGVKEPFCELPELSCSCLALLLQPHVVLSQVMNLLLQYCFILFLLNTHTHRQTRNQHKRG